MPPSSRALADLCWRLYACSCWTYPEGGNTCRVPRARARARQVVPISELVFETLSQHLSSFEDRRPTRRCHRVFRLGVGFLSKAVGHPDAPAPEAQVVQPKIARHLV